jgi:osmotically inducible protein OsmC
MAAESSARAVWEGDLTGGEGTVEPGSGAFPTQEITWARRTGEGGGGTTPEELLAAAHAACFSMALSHGLAEAGTPPERVETSAVVTFVPGEGVKSSQLTVHGRVPGIDADAFRKAAEDAKEGCPISGALAGNVELSVEATLDES